MTLATAAPICSLENYLVLPDHTMDERIGAAREALGRDCVILGHHYQRDEVIRYADFRGDSYRLSQEAAMADGKYIVFCGVHFMTERMLSAIVILLKGQCSVHQHFLPEHVDNVRAKYPGIRVIVHPECRWEVCQKADGIGSTEGLLKMIRNAPAGTMFAVGTEIHLVNRMGKEFAGEGKKVITLDDSGCLCTTMFRISPQHLCWALENLVEGNVVNQIKVRDDMKHWAKVALDRMLEIL